VEGRGKVFFLSFLPSPFPFIPSPLARALVVLVIGLLARIGLLVEGLSLVMGASCVKACLASNKLTRYFVISYFVCCVSRCLNRVSNLLDLWTHPSIGHSNNFCEVSSLLPLFSFQLTAAACLSQSLVFETLQYRQRALFDHTFLVLKLVLIFVF